MRDQSIRTSPSLLPRKRESPDIRRTRFVSKIEPRCNKSKPEQLTSSKIYDGFQPPESTDENFEKPYDHQKKPKLFELTRTNQETCDGVQEFIKQVSDFIKMKNFDREAPKNGGSVSFTPIHFNGTRRKSQEKQYPGTLKLEGRCEILPNEKVRNYKEHPKLREKIHSAEYFKRESDVLKARQTRPLSSAKKRNQDEKFSQRELSKTESIIIKKPPDGYFYPNVSREKNLEISRKTSLSGEETVAAAEARHRFKNKRKSEIPLRKNRTYSAKPVSWLLHKPLKETESSISFDFCPSGRPFLSLQEQGLCSYIEMKFSMNPDYENIAAIKDCEKNKSYDSEVGRTGAGLNKRWLTSVVPDNLDSSNKSPADKPSIAGRENVIDVEKAITSFNLLQTDSTVLQRLESFHKQNINLKEAKVQLKPKMLATKTSLHSLVGKSSKKSLSTLLSSKGNKLGLKMKMKKNQIPDPGEPKKLKKCCADKMKVLELEKNENVFLKSRKSELLKKNNAQLHRKVTSSKAKLSLSQPKTPKDKEKKVERTTYKPVLCSTEPEKEYLKKTISEKSQPNSDIDNSPPPRDCNDEAEKLNDSVNDKITPATLPSTPDNLSAKNDQNKPTAEDEQEDDDGWSSKTITFDDKFSNENICVVEFDRKNQNSDLFIKGTPLIFGQEEHQGKSDEEKGLKISKKMLKIDLSSLKLTDSAKTKDETECFSFEWDFPKIEKEDVVSPNERGRENMKVDFLSSKVTEEPVPLNEALKKPRKSCSLLKRKTQNKSAVKMVRKKKIRSDVGDRRLRTPSFGSIVNFDISLQNTTETDASKLRSDLTKPPVWEEKRDVFEDVAAIKLRRRNSEPLSFRGYIWKCADFPRGHKASVSSMASSLKHLNTDEIDDFVLWEAVPQNLTSCWEMSLYHGKRPWSVLSCSVFKDNQKSSTPGLILENLRNEGNNTRRSPISQHDRVNNHKQNPFDVEPSIAQKNIDIRNWLAALNFPTIPSTSVDVFGEGNFPAESAVDHRNSNEIQVNLKRRKILPNSKFSDEGSDKKLEDKEKLKKTTKLDEGEGGGLTDLSPISRKSGGLVTKEQYLNSEHSIRRPNVTVNLCMYSKSAEGSSVMVETSEKSSPFEPRKYKSVEVTSQPQISISATIIGADVTVGDQVTEKCKKEKGQIAAKKEDDKQFVLTFGQLTTLLIQELGRFVFDGNIWKYLFIFGLFVAVVHCCFLKAYLCHN